MQKMQFTVHLRPSLVLSIAFASVAIAVVPTAQAAGGSSNGIYKSRPTVNMQQNINCIGATGIQARIYKGLVVKVEGVIEGSPADGKFKMGQILTGAGGEPFEGNNLYIVLGNALTAAEATDGKIVFDVKDGKDAAPHQVTLQIPVLGTYSDTWPIGCDKSKKIVKRAADFYATDPQFKRQYLDSRGIGGALTCLFLMSTGDDAYLPVVKEYFANFPKDVKGIGEHTWNNGYNGIACGEYYLRTGDKSVLPILQYYCDDAKKRQKFGRGWVHWGNGISAGYVAGGLMNPAGSQLLTTMLLGKECGVDVDEKTLLGALRFWYRFTGHGTVPYGDHRPEGGLGSNGKDGMSAAAMQIACGAKGNVEIYRKARKYLSMSTLTSYPLLVTGHGDDGRGDGIWRGIASAYMLDYDPAQYHETMNRLKWWYDLSRRPSGALGMATTVRFDDVGSGAAVALSYTAPMKTLRITGAPRSKYAVDFTLPERLWGNEADLAFLSTEPNPKYYKYGKDEPIHVPFLKFGGAYNKPIEPLDTVPRKEMLKNVYHARYMIRVQAAKALRATRRFEDLETLLTDDDPRVRRAALDGMIDYNYWFAAGRDAIKTEDFSPKMVAAIRAMLSNPNESLWVIDGALAALRFAPAADIEACRPLIMPWTTHDDWWLRESAFMALAGLEKDDTLYVEILPTLLDLMTAEYHTQPRARMLSVLSRSLARRKQDSTIKNLILPGMLTAARESTVLEGPRAGEGAENVYKAALECVKYPEAAVEIGKIVQQRSDELGIAKVANIGQELLKRRENVSPTDREALTDIIYDYREGLIEQLRAGKLDDSRLIDTIVDFSKLKDPSVGWHRIGTPPSEDRVWRYTTIEPAGKDVMHPSVGRRHRQIALPKELENWMDPGFDDSKWQQGKAPIGVGVFGTAGRDAHENNSTWGDGEFILMRTTFEVTDNDYDKYRLRVLANKGFTVYLNGRQIVNYIWWEKKPFYKPFEIGRQHHKLFRKGKNVLAVYAGAGYRQDNFEPIGQIDLYIEGLNTSDFK